MKLVSAHLRATNTSRGFSLLVVLLSLLGVCHLSGADLSPDLAQWRAERLQRLTSPHGWLTLVGLEWLKPGTQSVGSASTNAIVLARGPVQLGELLWEQNPSKIVFRPQPDVAVSVDGQALVAPLELSEDEEKPTLLTVGTLTLQVISRGERKALRIKDSEAQTRTCFSGLEYFPEDASWRIEARWVPFTPAPTIKIQNIVGTISAETVPGKAVFEYAGNTYELWPIQEAGDDGLFFIFSDQTSGKETYGAARFLFTDSPKDGKVLLDFNRAINPPCAFTPFATCPLPPKQNRLSVPVTAGEKMPLGGHPAPTAGWSAP